MTLMNYRNKEDTMRIKIGNKTYNPDDVLIMIHLTEYDKKLIEDMSDDCSVIFYFNNNDIDIADVDRQSKEFKNECKE